MSAQPLEEALPLTPRIRPVPVTDPPPALQPVAARAPRGAEPLTLAWPGPAAVRAVEPGRGGSPDELPDPQRAAATLAVAVMEVLNGVRPASQLVRWTNHEVHAALARRAAVNARLAQQPSSRRPPVVRAVRVCRPVARVAETSAVVVSPDRVRAMAIRLEATDGRWRATALEIG